MKMKQVLGLLLFAFSLMACTPHEEGRHPPADPLPSKDAPAVVQQELVGPCLPPDTTGTFNNNPFTHFHHTITVPIIANATPISGDCQPFYNAYEPQVWELKVGGFSAPPKRGDGSSCPCRWLTDGAMSANRCTMTRDHACSFGTGCGYTLVYHGTYTAKALDWSQATASLQITGTAMPNCARTIQADFPQGAGAP